MDIRLLRSFIMVADCLNFTEASKRLFLSQSTLSGQIASLEAELGVTLLARDKRSVSLTAAGAVFLQDAHDLLHRYTQSLERLRQASTHDAPSLKLGFLSGPFYRFLPNAIRTFSRLHPEVRLEIEGRAEKALRDGLADGSFDLTLTVDWAAGLNFMEDGAFLEIGRDRFSAVLPLDHPLALQTSIQLSQLQNERFILLDRRENPQNYDALIRLCGGNGFFPRVSSSVHFIRDVFMLVEAGLGVALMADSLCAGYEKQVRVLPLQGQSLENRTMAVWRKRNENPALPMFLEVCRAALDKPAL